MPPVQRGHVRKLPSGRYQLRYYDAAGERQPGGVFPTRSAAYAHYRDVIEPGLRGAAPQLTLAALVARYLDRHAAVRSPRTIRSLRERLQRPLAAYGDVPLHQLERISGDLADWRATLPNRYAHQVMGALRQVLAAAVRWGYMTQNPAVLAGENPTPPPRAVRVYTPAELAAISREMPTAYAAVPVFAAATGFRPAEWARLERGHVDRAARLVHVHGTKTSSSVLEVPLTTAALAALDAPSRRIDTPLVFPAFGGGPLNPDNWRRRVWTPPSRPAASGRPRASTICAQRSRRTPSPRA